MGVWEKINNPDFNYSEFGVIGQEAGTNRFMMSVGQWTDRTKAVGMFVKAGRYGGTYAHKDIAFHFAMWLSPEFQIYLVNEFQRLKDDENDRLKLEWNLQRTLSKVNYQIHTDAIKENLIPKEITKQQASFVYANEADLLNVALFGITAKVWKENNPDSKGNIRDYATLEQLVVLSNMESINALLIGQGLTQSDRLIRLNKVAISQMKSLLESNSIKKLK
ncbi:MAG: KilA-N domain-containing protein [Methylococcaceae bacterium]